MSTTYEDWTDWAGDHPELAEADLRKERDWAEHRMMAARSNIQDRDGADSAALYAAERRESCLHEDISNQGVCEDCGDEVEGWEPSEAQMDQHYGTEVVR